jgi:hypothetical protein
MAKKQFVVQDLFVRTDSNFGACEGIVTVIKGEKSALKIDVPSKGFELEIGLQDLKEILEDEGIYSKKLPLDNKR